MMSKWRAFPSLKSYRGIHADGCAWETVKRWFGYKIHLLVDATYELPVAWTLTKASTADITEAPQLLKQLKTRHPLVLGAARLLTADRGYDGTAFPTECWADYHIKPVIDIRNIVGSQVLEPPFSHTPMPHFGREKRPLLADRLWLPD